MNQHRHLAPSAQAQQPGNDGYCGYPAAVKGPADAGTYRNRLRRGASQSMFSQSPTKIDGNTAPLLSGSTVLRRCTTLSSSISPLAITSMPATSTPTSSSQRPSQRFFSTLQQERLAISGSAAMNMLAVLMDDQQNRQRSSGFASPPKASSTTSDQNCRSSPSRLVAVLA